MKTASRGIIIPLISAVALTCFGTVSLVRAQGYSELPPPLPPGGYPGLDNSLQAPSQSLSAHAFDMSALEAMAAEANTGEAFAPQGPIGSAIAEQLAPPAPLTETHVAWYRKYPWLWIPLDGWNNSVEFGLNGSDGNSRTTSTQVGADLERATDRYTFSIDFDYQNTDANGVQTQDNGRLNVDYDRLLGESAWSAFTKMGLEFDQFKAFDLRLNLNSGLGYYWVRTDQSTLVTRFGAGASREFGGPNEDWVPEALFGLEAAQQITERQKVKAQIEYFPQWDRWSDYRMVTDVSWEILLDGIDNLSLKLAATNRYDSTPNGLDPNDLFYSALLLWKF